MTHEEIEAFVRFWLGDISEEVISSDTIQAIIAMVEDMYPEATDCQLKYYSTVNVLKWLIRAEAGSASGGGGAVSSREEKRGDSRIKVEYDTSEEASDWGTVLGDLEDDPSSIGCEPFPVNPELSMGKVMIGISGDKYKPNAPWNKTLHPNKPLDWPHRRTPSRRG